MTICKIKLTAIFLFLFLNTSIPLAQDFNSIDAVSSASQKLQVIGGKAYSDHAEIIWKDSYTNGEAHTLKWGKTTSYGNSINLKPFTKNQNVTTMIQGLEASTSYYGQFYRTYEGSIKKTNFVFQTTDGTANISSFSPKNNLTKIKSVNVIDDGISINYQISQIGKTSIAVYNISGKMIAKITKEHIFTGQYSDIININSKSLSTGIYLIKFVNNASNHAEIFNVVK